VGIDPCYVNFLILACSACPDTKYVIVAPAFCRMDEVLLQSDDWKELIKRRGDWVQFLKASVCAHYWHFTQAQVKCQLLNVYCLCVYLLEMLLKI
jgi:hypothetical protein